MTKGKSLRSSHLLIIGRASTIILISIITTGAIIITHPLKPVEMEMKKQLNHP